MSGFYFLFGYPRASWDLVSKALPGVVSSYNKYVYVIIWPYLLGPIYLQVFGLAEVLGLNLLPRPHFRQLLGPQNAGQKLGMILIPRPVSRTPPKPKPEATKRKQALIPNTISERLQAKPAMLSHYVIVLRAGESNRPPGCLTQLWELDTASRNFMLHRWFGLEVKAMNVWELDVSARRRFQLPVE